MVDHPRVDELTRCITVVGVIVLLPDGLEKGRRAVCVKLLMPASTDETVTQNLDHLFGAGEDCPSVTRASWRG